MRRETVPSRVFFPKGKPFFGWFHQVVAKAFFGYAGGVDQLQEVAFHVRPAPLQPAKAPIPAGAIAMDDAREGGAEQLLEHLGSPAGATGEESKRHGGRGYCVMLPDDRQEALSAREASASNQRSASRPECRLEKRRVTSAFSVRY